MEELIDFIDHNGLGFSTTICECRVASKAVQYLCARTLKKSRIGHAQSRAKKHTLALLRNGPLTAPLRTLPPKMPLYVHILIQLL